MSKFTINKNEFNQKFKEQDNIKAFVPVHLTIDKMCVIKGKNKDFNEEYYKWQLVYSLIYSGLVNKDYIGVEVNLPKGNKNSANIKLDIAIFDNVQWYEYYKKISRKKRTYFFAMVKRTFDYAY